MRAAAGLALLLAACSPNASGTSQASGEVIDCATGGAVEFTHACAVEKGIQNGDPVLVVQDPNGAFRRFIVLDGGKSVAAADGAQALAVAGNGDRVDASVDGDRYRFPAKLLRDAAAGQ